MADKKTTTFRSSVLEKLLADLVSSPMDYGARRSAADYLGLTDDITTPETLTEKAREIYQEDGRIEIDDDSPTSEADDGTWVAAWVRVPDNEEDDG